MGSENEEVLVVLELPSCASSSCTSSNSSSTTCPSIEPSLSRPLQILYALNGMTLALPTTALLYIVNTRLQMPFHLLPTYGAVVFLPFSLKPIYASLENYYYHCRNRFRFIAVLLFVNALLIGCTQFISTIAICFVIGFLRETTNAWPELLLGLSLMDEANKESTTTTTTATATATATATTTTTTSTTTARSQVVAAHFQTQAATARNAGSLIAHSIVLLYFETFKKRRTHNSMNRTDASVLLTFTACLALGGAILAFRCSQRQNNDNEDYSYHHYQTIPSSSTCPSSHERDASAATTTTTTDTDPLCLALNENCSFEQTEENDPEYGRDETPIASSSLYSKHNIGLIVLLQSTVILLTLRHPVSKALSTTSWGLLTCTLGIALVVLIYMTAKSTHWVKRTHNIGLFLVLRHMLPSASYVIESFLYDVFHTRPAFLQALSLVSMITATVSSWSFSPILLSLFTHVNEALIALTSILAFAASLGSWWLVRQLLRTTDGSIVQHFLLTLVIKTFSVFLDEWNFLPDVILSTQSVLQSSSSSDHHEGSSSRASSPTTSMEYATLISCIDFGDQLGALLTSPLVIWFGLERDSRDPLDTFVLVCSFLTLVPIGWLFLIR